MAAKNFTSTLSLQYTPPSAPTNSGVATLAVTGTYNGGQSGTIDVPNGTTADTSFSVPFGSLASAKLLVIRNNMSTDIAVRLNGAVADSFRIAAGGQFAYMAPTAPSTVPITSAIVRNSADPTATEEIQFWAFGD